MASLVISVVIALALVADVVCRYLAASRRSVPSVSEWSRCLPLPVVAALGAVAINFVGFVGVILLVVASVASLEWFKTDAAQGIGEKEAVAFERNMRLFGGISVASVFVSELVCAALMLRVAINLTVSFFT